MCKYLGEFFSKVFLTTILWAVLMFLYGYLSIGVKKVNLRVYEWKFIIPFVSIMVVYTIICRVGFGSPTPLEPSWTYNTSILDCYHQCIQDK